MFKLILATTLLLMSTQGAFGGIGGYAYPNYGLGYGFIAGGGYPHYPSAYGYRGGVAAVKHHQDPFNYGFSVNEQGPGYSKYHYQSASAIPIGPVYGGYGYGK